MIEIVMNEKDWVESALRDGQIGKRPAVTIGRLAKYYHAQGLRKKDIKRNIDEFMARCDASYNPVRWQDTIDAMVKSVAKYPLIEIDHISVTVKEMEAILSLDGSMRQRLMFTLLCLAKYGNAVRDTNKGWVNYESKDIFALANITLTSKRQALAINDLWSAGYIGYSRIVDNVNLCVQIIDDESDTAIEISDFRNLGNQFRAYMNEKAYFRCANCGLMIRRSSPNHKYCPECAVDINRATTLQKYRKSTAND